MTVHQRPQSVSIDPDRLGKLAEVAVRVGLNLQPGQDLFLTAPVAALPLVRLIAEQAYKAGAGWSRRSSPTRRSRWRAIAMPPMPASTGRRPGSIAGSRRPSPRTPRGSPWSATIRCCSPTRIPTRSGARPRPIRWPISRRWRRSPASTSTGTSSPTRRPPGRAGCSRARRRRSRSRSWRRRSSPPRGSTSLTPSRPGRRIMRPCIRGATG